MKDDEVVVEEFRLRVLTSEERELIRRLRHEYTDEERKRIIERR